MYEQIARNKRRAVLYVLLFFIVWVGIGALLGFIVGHMQSTSTATRSSYYATPAPTATTSHVGADVAVGMVIFGILAGLGILYTFTAGHKMVLSISGAAPADPTQYAQLHNIVEALAIGDGLPKPEVYVIDDPSPNAFATGISPQRAAITATTGLLAIMNREELEGVIAHEMSHIKNYDVRILLIVSTLIGMAGLLASMLWRAMFFAPRRRDRDDNQLYLILMVAGILLAIVGFVIGPLIKLALSRRRESLADASGVELTRNPAGLLGALKKLQQNDEPFAKMNHVTAAMCIDDPLAHHESWFHHLFDTHPPLEQRIAALEKIASGQSL